MNKNVSKKEEIAVIILIIVFATGFLIYFVNRFRGMDLNAVIEENIAELQDVEQGYLDKLAAGMDQLVSQFADQEEQEDVLIVPEENPEVVTDEEMIAAIKAELEKSDTDF